MYISVCVYSFFKPLRSQRYAGLPKYLTFLPRPRNKCCLKKHFEQLLALFEMSWAGISVLVITNMYGSTPSKAALAFFVWCQAYSPWSKGWNGHGLSPEGRQGKGVI